MIDVLIVEDDMLDRELVELRVKIALGGECKFIYCTSLKGTLKALSEKKFNVMFLDLNLPDSKGVETVNTIRTQDQETPIIVISDVLGEDFSAELQQADVQAFIAKSRMSTGSLPAVLSHIL